MKDKGYFYIYPAEVMQKVRCSHIIVGRDLDALLLFVQVNCDIQFVQFSFSSYSLLHFSNAILYMNIL